MHQRKSKKPTSAQQFRSSAARLCTLPLRRALVNAILTIRIASSILRLSPVGSANTAVFRGPVPRWLAVGLAQFRRWVQPNDPLLRVIRFALTLRRTLRPVRVLPLHCNTLPSRQLDSDWPCGDDCDRAAACPLDRWCAERTTAGRGSGSLPSLGKGFALTACGMG